MFNKLTNSKIFDARKSEVNISEKIKLKADIACLTHFEPMLHFYASLPPTGHKSRTLVENEINKIRT